MINRQWILTHRPRGMVQREDFERREAAVPSRPLEPGEVLIRYRVFLCAPTMRNWMDAQSNSFYRTIDLGQPVMAPAAGEVVASADARFPAGAHVTALGTWQDYEIIDCEARGVAPIAEGLSFVEAMGKFGLNTLTGYFGMLRVGRPQPGETVVVSGAAGSTGSTAAQIAKLKGCRVIGIAGGEEKCRWLVQACGIDAAIDYKIESVRERLAELCPGGIDIFYDNVGGEILQAAVDNMARHGRIVLCGQIATYNDDEPAEGPRNMMRIIYGSIRIQGFLLNDYGNEFDSALKDLRAWSEAGKLIHREDVRRGFDTLPETFAALFTGQNKGTLLVEIGDSD